MTDKNPFLEDQEKEKIGFSSQPPLVKGEKIERFQDKLPGKGLRKSSTVFTVFGIIFSVLTMMYFLLPIFSAIIGGFLAFLLIMFMIFSVIVTLGIALTIEDYRNWIGNDMMDIPNFFFNISDNIAKLAPYFLVVAIPALIFTLTGLILAIVGKAKKYRYFISQIVLCSIFFTFALIFTLFYFGLKMNVIIFD